MSLGQSFNENGFFFESNVYLDHFIWLTVHEPSSRVDLIEYVKDTFLQTYIDLNLDRQSHSKTLKIGSNFYHVLDKRRSLLFMIKNKVYLFPLDHLNQFVMIILRENHITTYFETLMKPCASIVSEIHGNDPTLDAIILFVQESLGKFNFCLEDKSFFQIMASS